MGWRRCPKGMGRVAVGVGDDVLGDGQWVVVVVGDGCATFCDYCFGKKPLMGIVVNWMNRWKRAVYWRPMMMGMQLSSSHSSLLWRLVFGGFGCKMGGFDADGRSRQLWRSCFAVATGRRFEMRISFWKIPLRVACV